MSFMDAQFDRAVEIVQGLPKTGPVGVVLDTMFDGHSFLFYRYRLTMKRSLQCTGMNRFIYELLPLTRTFPPACTSKVRYPVLSTLAYHFDGQLATVGNVKSPRPAMWDMLGRAKWYAALPCSQLVLNTFQGCMGQT